MQRPDTGFTPVLADRGMVLDALALIEDHGRAAGDEAQARARAARNQGNVLKFCRWRQIDRLIAQLADPARATVH